MSEQRLPCSSTCVLKSYTPAWEVGSGVPTSLAPGAYQITSCRQIGGVIYWDLEATHRIDSRRASTAKAG